ncbi:hypothetical protein Tco_1137736, partial [Tanacetum coccineum]
MVAFLEKPTKSVGFEEIVYFLNAHLIRYALTINPTIYVSCIEQFWSTTKTKTINGETQIHALVDGKKIVITETSVRRDLQFADEDGKVTPLFDTMLIQNQADVDEGSGQPTDPQCTPISDQPSITEQIIAQSSHQPKRPTNLGSLRVSLERDATTVSSLEEEQVSGVNTPRSDEDSIKLKELTEFYTKLQQRVIDMENTKTTQAQEITSLKLRVK